MKIPQSLVAGDSIDLLESYADYPASAGWVLRYVLVNAAGKHEFVSAAEGDDHRMVATSAATAAWAAGSYTAILVATLADARATLGELPVVVKPDPIASSQLDGRSETRKQLDALRAAYSSMIATGGLAQSVEFNGRKTTFRSAEDIILQIQMLERQLAAETTAKNLQSGLGLGGRILTRL